MHNLENSKNSISDFENEENLSTMVAKIKAFDINKEEGKLYLENHKLDKTYSNYSLLMSYAVSEPIKVINDENEFKDFPHLNMLNDRIYVEGNGIDIYRDKLELLLGRIVYIGENIKTIGGLRFIKNNYEIKSEQPKDGLIESHTFTQKDNTSVGLFLGINLSNDELAQYTVTDTYKTVLDTDQIDDVKLLNGLQTMNELATMNKESLHLISGISVTEITSKNYKKKGRKISVSNLPQPASAFSFENSLYTSNEKFKRTYKIGLTMIDLNRLVAEMNLQANGQ